MKNNFFKYLFLFWFGGSIYFEIENLWRGYSYFEMFVTGGVIFILCGMLNEIYDWDLGLIAQTLIGWVSTLLIELSVGIVCNLWLGMSMWDYSNMPGNILGQICPQYALLWLPLIVVAILVDDVIRWKFLSENQPRYHIGNKVFYLGGR